METIAIHQSKQTAVVSKFIDLSVKSLAQYCSVKYAKRIISAYDNGSLWGVYFTPSGKIRAAFI